MQIDQWRTGLQQWLSTFLVVDSWDLKNPTEYQKTNGFIPPLQNISFNKDDIGSATANQDFYLTTRYSGEIKYNSLPLGKLEQLYTSICRRLTLTYANIAPLTDLRLLTVGDGIQIQEYGDGLADWLITMVFSVDLTWIHTPTALPGDILNTQPLELKRIDIGLFTELMTSDRTDPTQRSKVGDLPVRAQNANL
jgi:hypothetical protein